MEILELIDGARARIDVLAHPFYRRWNAGRLDPQELALYAAEYRHAVVALADAAERAAQCAAQSGLDERICGQLQRHAREERDHVELWDRFAEAVGADTASQPLAQTRACVSAWVEGCDVLDHLAVLYAIEGAQPAISETKLRGLQAHYGIAPDSPALSYFELHRKLDVEHAREAGALLESLADDGDRDRLLAAAENALRGNWLLLDGVDRSACVPGGIAGAPTV